MTDAEIIRELKSRWVSKWELCDMLNLPRTSNGERKARLYTEQLTQVLLTQNSCVLSTAARKGYHIPDPLDEGDVALARGAVEELKSKAIAVFERRKPIENFLKFSTSMQDAIGNVQLTLF